MRSRSRGAAYVVGPFGAGTRSSTALPYGVEHLQDHGWDVTYADPEVARAPPHRAVRLVHRRTRTPVLEPLLEPRRLRRAELVVCLLEDNATVLATALRLLRRRVDRPSVLVVVWLAGDVRALSLGQRRRWRRRLTAFDDVVVFSANQVGLLTAQLGLPAGLVRAVPFGVAPLTPTGTQGSGVLSVGGDRGRDFATLLTALDGLTAPDGRPETVTVVTTTAHRAAIPASGSVRVVGPVPRAAYLDLLRSAQVYVSPTFDLDYPTGQTALIEAMQVGKPCVVSRSAALADYVTDGVDAVLVPPGDPDALRTAVGSLLADADLRAALGTAAARNAARFTEAAMWSAVAAGVPGRD